eukprot:211876_1
MASVIKISNRFTNRSLLNKLHLQTNRTISTFYKLQLYPAISNQCNVKTYSLFQPITPNSLLSHTSSHRFMSQTREDHEEEDTINKEQDDTSEEDTEQEDIESAEESDNENEQITELSTKIEELESELKKYKDALARSHADLINVNNMSKKDVANAKQFATKSFSKDMLSVADALQSCLKIVDEHINEYIDKNPDNKINEHVKSVIDGVKLTENTLMQTFGRHGINKVESMKKEFDPNIHEALFKMPSNDVPPYHVVQVISEGYTIKNAVLRAAKVGVSSEPPPPPQQP